MKNKVFKILIVLLTLGIVFNSAFSTSIFAATNNEVTAIPEDTNTISGIFKENKSKKRSANLLGETSRINDVGSDINLTSLKAWINGTLVYEKDKTPNFPSSIYKGMSFKTALNWEVKDPSKELKGGDFFDINIGKIQGLGFASQNTWDLYIGGILIGQSIMKYDKSNYQLSYSVVFNDNISYFESIHGEFVASSTFSDLPNNGKIDIEFITGGKGEVVIIEKPNDSAGGGDVGVGLPVLPAISKELKVIGKSTYASDTPSKTFGWRVVFTDLIHKNQNNINNPDNDVYGYTIIEDTLDENQEFVAEAESGFKAPFFLDIPFMLPGTQSAVAYSTSSRETQVAPVLEEGNGNSEYIIKPDGIFTKKNSEEEVRATPLSWAIVTVNNRQKLVVNVGKLGTETSTEGITADMITTRYPSQTPASRELKELPGIINDEYKKYTDIRNNHVYSPYNVIKQKYEAFKELYKTNPPSEYAQYITDFDAYMGSLGVMVVPSTNPPAIPIALKKEDQAYKNFESAVSSYVTNMTLYEKMMLDGSAYKKTLDLIIEGLENAKVYYDKMGYDGANIGQRLYGFNLKYKTTVTNTSSGVVSNDVKITTDKQSYESDASVKHDFSSGINGVFSKGDIVVMKADSTQEYTEGMLETSKDISGIQDVQFEVYDAQSHEKLYFFNKDMSEHGSYQYYGKSASDSHFTSIVKTDDKGKFVLSGLLPNKEYYLKEVSTTDGYYENQNQKLVFTVDSRKVNYKLVENVARLVTLKKLDKNAEISGSLSALAGAKFGLFNDKNQKIDHFKKEVINGKTYFTYTNQASDNDELITLADGTLTIKNLPAGNYYIKEIAAPLGYILSDEKHHFTLDKNYNKDHEVVDLGNVYNLKNDASITVQKVDENTSVALENAAFELYKAPDGTSWSQGNHDDWQLITASQFNNANQYITSQKMDGNALLTNEDGEISISSLPKGNYYLKEVKAPNGYVLNKKHYHFTIDTGTKESQLYASLTLDETTVGRIDNNLITNKKGTGSIEIIKYDRFQGASLKIKGIAQNINQVFYDGSETQVTVKKPLKGVIFDLYKKVGDSVNLSNDTKIKTGLSTDNDGKIKVNDLEVGTYYFIEVKALDNYQLKQEPVIFEVTHQDVQENSKTLVRLVDNYQFEYKVILNKQDKQTGIKLEGAHFELYDSANKVMKFKYNEDKKVYEYDENGTSLLITNQDGQIIIDGLTPQQKYFFKEVKAPEGYKIDSQNNWYEVDIKQADESIVVSTPIVTEVTCTNEKIKTPNISQENKPDNSHSSESSRKPTTSDITHFGLGTLLLSGCLAFIAYKQKKKHI